MEKVRKMSPETGEAHNSRGKPIEGGTEVHRSRQGSGFPWQLIFLISVLIFSLLAILLRGIGMF
jgi:hypothetical protein